MFSLHFLRPEKIDELLPGDVVDVTISENPDGSRTVEVK